MEKKENMTTMTVEIPYEWVAEFKEYVEELGGEIIDESD